MTGSITISAYTYFAFDYSKDWFIERRINSASAMVEEYCNRKFVAETYDEFYTGLGSQELLIDNYPINKITSIKSESAMMTAGTDYVTSDRTLLDHGILYRGLGWPFYGYLTGLVGEITGPEAMVEVVYSAGYTAIPADIENIVLTMVAESYRNQQDGVDGLKSMTQGNLSYTWETSDVAKRYMDTLSKYKRW